MSGHTHYYRKHSGACRCGATKDTVVESNVVTESPPEPQEQEQPQPEPAMSVPAEQPAQPAPQPEQGQAQPAATPVITDPRQSQMHISYTPLQSDKVFGDERNEKGWPHARPFSCFVAAIGNHWKPKSWAHVMNMVEYANQQGMFTRLDEIQDRCQEPYDALGVMRNEAIMRAESGGFEYLVMIDNDVLPTHDTLVKLLRRMWLNQVTCLAPYVIEPGTNRVLHGPVADQFTGIRPVRWNVLSMIAFRTSIFRAFPPGGFWDNPLGADEGYHYQKLYNAGHTPFVDTDIMLPVYHGPTYPLTIDKQENAEQLWESRRESFRGIPDRSPLEANDPRVNEQGVYMPFLQVVCRQENGGCGMMKPGEWWKHGPVCAECAQRIAQSTTPAGATVAQEQTVDGHYSQCKAIDGETRCSNMTPAGHGFCHLHLDRVPS